MLEDWALSVLEDWAHSDDTCLPSGVAACRFEEVKSRVLEPQDVITCMVRPC